MIRPVDLLGDILEEGDVPAVSVHIDAGVAGAVPGNTEVSLGGCYGPVAFYCQLVASFGGQFEEPCNLKK